MHGPYLPLCVFIHLKILTFLNLAGRYMLNEITEKCCTTYVRVCSVDSFLYVICVCLELTHMCSAIKSSYF